MDTLTDQQLLRDYTGARSEPAFAELVHRYVDLVYSAALRMVRDAHLAQDVTQGVFVVLAQNAHQLTDRPVLSGWLHRTARNLAANAVRSDIRRRIREQEAATMNELLSAPDASWHDIAPQLDAALGELSESDRDAVLLRFFQRKSAQEMAEILGLSSEAAQKRVNRAVERLRENFSKRKVTIGASGLAIVISANAVQSAPVGMAAAISTAAFAAGTVATTSTAIATATTIAMTALQKALVVIAIAAAAGAGIYEAHQASQLRRQNETLQEQQAPVAAQIAKFQSENTRLSNLVADAKDQKSLSTAQLNELLKLRNQTGQGREAISELAKMKTTMGHQPDMSSSVLSNAFAQGISMAEKFRRKDAQAKLGRMHDALHLTDDQTQAINALMMTNIDRSSQQTLNAMMGKQTPPDQQPAPATSEEDSIKALLTPDQLANYPAFQQSETEVSAKKGAQSELALMTSDMELTPDQQQQALSAIYQLKLNQAQAANSDAANAISQARASGNIADLMNLQVQKSRQNLDDELTALNGILTPDQLKTYQQKQLDMLDVQASAMKMFVPPASNSAVQQ